MKKGNEKWGYHMICLLTANLVVLASCVDKQVVLACLDSFIAPFKKDLFT